MTTCSVDGCDRSSETRGWCTKHYARVLRHGTTTLPLKMHVLKVCSIDGCNRPVYGHGWCAMHWKRWYKYGDPTYTVTAPHGDETINQDGYRVIHANGKSYLEHRKVMERTVGRELLASEVVHHKDGNRLNNDPDNLEIMSFSEHTRMHQLQRWRLLKQQKA